MDASGLPAGGRYGFLHTLSTMQQNGRTVDNGTLEQMASLNLPAAQLGVFQTQNVMSAAYTVVQILSFGENTAGRQQGIDHVIQQILEAQALGRWSSCSRP